MSALLVASITRASTNCLNDSEPTTSNPTSAYACSRTSHKTRAREPATVGDTVTGAATSPSKSKACCPARIFVFATSINTANSTSSCAEPMCSTIVRTPRCFDTICTATAPDAVFTRRKNNPTRTAYEHRISAPLGHQDPPKTNDHDHQIAKLTPTWHESGRKTGKYLHRAQRIRRSGCEREDQSRNQEPQPWHHPSQVDSPRRRSA